MTLDEFRVQKGLTYKELSIGIGVAGPAVARRYCKKSQIPSREIMPAIYKFTNGAVTPNDFFDLESKGAGSCQSGSE